MSEENRQELLDLLAGYRARARSCAALAVNCKVGGPPYAWASGKAQAYDHAVILLEDTLELMGVALETSL